MSTHGRSPPRPDNTCPRAAKPATRLQRKEAFLANSLIPCIPIEVSTTTTTTETTPTPRPDVGPSNCPICLDVLSPNPKAVFIRKCHHAFHEVCLKLWLKKHNTCPTCRQGLFRVPERPPGPLLYGGQRLSPLGLWAMVGSLEEGMEEARQRPGSDTERRRERGNEEQDDTRGEGGGWLRRMFGRGRREEEGR